jgi:sRNA-binding regulator protein Hfq
MNELTKPTPTNKQRYKIFLTNGYKYQGHCTYEDQQYLGIFDEEKQNNFLLMKTQITVIEVIK